MIVTIDGPAGSGKSTAARELASRLQVAYLDTGAMYRAVTLKALECNVDLEDDETLPRLARESDIRMDCRPAHPRVLLEGRDVSEAIRSMRVNRATGRVARVPGVRGALVEKQRQVGRELGALVAEGRDQGSVVFPEADHKFLFGASLAGEADVDLDGGVDLAIGATGSRTDATRPTPGRVVVFFFPRRAPTSSGRACSSTYVVIDLQLFGVTDVSNSVEMFFILLDGELGLRGA